MSILVGPETGREPRGRRPLDAFVDAGVVPLACRASLLLLLIDAREDPRTLVAAALLVVIAFFRPPLYQSPILWLGIGLPLLAVQLWRWEGLDDHVVLTTVWFCALGFALLSEDPPEALRTSARLLIGFTFLFATLWKLSSFEFLSGRMFHELLLDDPRFRLISHWLGGLSDRQLDDNVAVVEALGNRPGAPPARLFDTAAAGVIAQIMTWGTLVIEAFVSIAWLAGDRPAARRVRLTLLLVFCLTTYLILPVTAFAAVLITMALATTPPGDRRRLWLVGAFTFLALYSPLWNVLVPT